MGLAEADAGPEGAEEADGVGGEEDKGEDAGGDGAAVVFVEGHVACGAVDEEVEEE